MKSKVIFSTQSLRILSTIHRATITSHWIRVKFIFFDPKKQDHQQQRMEKRDKDGEEIDVEGKAARFCPHKVSFFAFDWNWSWSHICASNNSHTRKVQISFVCFHFRASRRESEIEWWIMNDWNVTETRILHSFCIMLMMNNQSIVSGVCLAALAMRWNYLLMPFNGQLFLFF